MDDRNPIERIPVLLAWSGGKDSALALQALLDDARWQVVGLLTTGIEPACVVSMHRVPLPLIRDQAAALDLPLTLASIREGAPNSEYERSLATALQPWTEQGVRTVAFGDLYLSDIRAYRERVVRELGMDCVFPLWNRETSQLAGEFIAGGYRAWTCCVDAEKLAVRFCGREFDADFLRDLPAGIDPCGENGEFHTFVADGPSFSRPVPISTGEVVRRGDFWYCDITRDTGADGVRRHAARATGRFYSGASNA